LEVRHSSWGGFVEEEPPELAPIIATEIVGDGWRGLTAEGEVYAVANGKVPTSIMIAQAERLVGWRQVAAVNGVSIADYLTRFETAMSLHRQNRNSEALEEIELALGVADTTRARFNRAMILLALGYWPEGFIQFEFCERVLPFLRPQAQTLATRIRPWRGERLYGKRLLLVHDHGLGDTLMMLRFASALRARGADLVFRVPRELEQIAGQFGTVDNSLDVAADYFTSFLHLLRWLAVTPTSVPAGPYVTVDPTCVARWRDALPTTARRRIGVAWSVGVEQDEDFPRSLPIAEIVERFGDAEYHSLQVQDLAAAGEVGVVCHDFADLADCAALMSLMDEVVSVDTCAIHLAGAIGHPHATLLLSKWHSWRWQHGNPFYPNIHIEDSGR
jgi:hypothetical protein